ncbi:peptidase S51-like protein [Oceanotoga teriensis]|uniref:Peptidase S51-like protein n=1 Tax=Oceanotoga teriensis TaxID=515440 RepID=A0AA45HJC4_9BACT|nr:Type 1 glutamine amidotransferase-like domain-containing protein [Oceanotoga teriensis]PWJ95914.1 peptidase S51-like protein [Oceanotoga teriensis]
MVNILLSEYRLNENWIKNEVFKYLNSDYNVVIIPFSFSENEISNDTEWQKAYSKETGSYYNIIIKQFLDFNIKENNIKWLNYYAQDNDEMISIIEKSDIVFLTGGYTKKAVKRIIKKNLVNSIKKSKVVIGASAGALMQFNEYFASPDENFGYDKFNYYDGLKLINSNFMIEVHYNDTKSQNDSIKRALKEKVEKVYALTNEGGLIINNNTIKLLGNVIEFKK